jgi:hypothetical protein
MRAVRGRDPGRPFHVRTTAPAAFFEPVLGPGGSTEAVAVDTGVVERDPLRIDGGASLARAASFFAGHRRLVDAEVRFAAEHRVGLVVADIPYIAAEVARGAGVPCVAIGNFTWDWIYEPFTDEHPDYRELPEAIRGCYAAVDELLMLPFHDPAALVATFGQVVEVPLLARRSARDPAETRREIGLGPDDGRPLALIGMRGGLPPGVVDAVARGAPDWVFVELGAAGPRGNVYGVHPGPRLSFLDILRAADVVVSKLGYGIVADAAANGTALLFPPRTGFREDRNLRDQAPRYLRMRELPLDDYLRGNWAPHLLKLRSTVPFLHPPRCDGADVCSGMILRHL